MSGRWSLHVYRSTMHAWLAGKLENYRCPPILSSAYLSPLVLYSSLYVNYVMPGTYLLPPPWRKLCFHRCPLLCLFACLPVSNITEKRLIRFSWNFQGRWDLIQWTIGNIFRMLHLTLDHRTFFRPFRRNPWHLQHCRKTVQRIFMQF